MDEMIASEPSHADLSLGETHRFMVSPLGILASLTVGFSSLSRVCDKWQIFSVY